MLLASNRSRSSCKMKWTSWWTCSGLTSASVLGQLLRSGSGCRDGWDSLLQKRGVVPGVPCNIIFICARFRASSSSV